MNNEFILDPSGGSRFNNLKIKRRMRGKRRVNMFKHERKRMNFVNDERVFRIKKIKEV